jgi:hypothetical protein
MLLSLAETYCLYYQACKHITMSLEPKDIELLECIIYKNANDIAITLSRSFERLEERVDALESRLYTRISELEDRQESSHQDISDTISHIKDEIRSLDVAYRDRAAFEESKYC